ncbi:hypothetical protein POVWA2_023590 [Plasmodium ovale wallikeri]|uniref:Uncharacterized protein n=1 Tax=Plasmodium ovale wallikeri TaxID=864142 RepID=A0A1A8YT87_PLAOA|nr:hypothetical protein POVWA1_023790 [Plasmodium ovale wallikeri]SBT35156.1 hypothetical protein POVWA2_023590 [Plasmodium ovale wallikeri]
MCVVSCDTSFLASCVTAPIFAKPHPFSPFFVVQHEQKKQHSFFPLNEKNDSVHFFSPSACAMRCPEWLNLRKARSRT